MLGLPNPTVDGLISPYAVPLLVTAALPLLLGLLLVIRERGSVVSWSFALLTAGVAIGLVARAGTYSTPDPDRALPWARAAYLGVSFIPPATYLFAVVVVGTYRRRVRLVWAAWIVAALVAAVGAGTDALFADLYRYPWGYYPHYRVLIVPVLLTFAVPFYASLREYLLALRRSLPGSIYHRRARVLLVAFGLGYLAGVDFLPGFGIAVYPFGYLLVLLFLSIVAWAIWRYRLVDITPAFAANQIVETMTDALLVLDADGIVRLVNRAARDLFRFGAQEVVGRPLDRVVGKTLAASLLDCAGGGGAPSNREIVSASDPRNPRVLSVSLSRMRDRRGRTAAIVCVARDVTERVRQAEQILRQGEELRAAYDELQQTQAQVIRQERLYALGVMASGVAHNFNNALTPILAYGEVLLQRPHVAEDPEQRERYLRLMVGAARDASRMVARLREFYRPSAEGSPILPVDLHRTIQEAVELTRPRWSDQAAAQGKRVDVVTRLEPVPAISGNPTELREVLTNLIFNAVDAIEGEGTVTLRARTEGGDCVIDVADTGAGMSEDVRRHCFEPFFTTKGERGTGLGLSTIYGIVRRAGGTINVESTIGEGTTFTIRLPIRPIAVAEGAGDAGPDRPTVF